MVVEFALLGGIEARVGGALVDLGHTRQRCVLAVLLIEANRPVSIDRIVERIWGESFPQRAQGTLYSYLSRLRRRLAATTEVRIARHSGGYLLEIDAFAVDLHRFRALAAEARAAEDDHSAASMWRQALDLWHGDAFAAVDTPWFNALREALHRERYEAELDLVDVRLRLGEHAGLLPGLAARARADPLDERLAAQLMLAQYRGGRPAEALTHYRHVRRRLVEELGTDPGPELRRLHQQILTASPSLAAPAALAAPSSPHPRMTTATPVPRQLPAAPPVFIGRAVTAAELDRHLNERGDLGRGVAIATIGGAGGVGKTWLALHWAHRNAAAFPDGQLYVDLHGFVPVGEPVAPAAALRGFLDALGVAADAIPADRPGRAALYRSLVADKRMLIVLDNARDSEQVVPLLPGGPSCTVLVTSRRRLAGLTAAHGARSLVLGLLTETEARELLVHHLGPKRAAAEPQAVSALVDHCAGLPLAVAIVAARTAGRPGFPLAVLAAELQDRSARLDALGTDDPIADLRAVFASSYAALDPTTAWVFALLGAAPGPDIALAAASALTGLTPARTRSHLRALEAAHLTEEHVTGRHRMHDLVRLYAAERAREPERGRAREEALRRLVDFYVDAAHAGDRVLSPQRTPLAAARPPAASPPFRDATTAMSWFEAEHACLRDAHAFAMEHGLSRRAWELAWSLDTFQWRRGRLPERVAMLRATLADVDVWADPADRALAHRLLGRAHVPLADHADALEHLRRSLALSEAIDDGAGRAQAQLNLALAWEQHGDDRQALTHALENLRIRRTLDSPHREAEALNAVGWYQARLGDLRSARDHCERALALCRRHGFREGEAFTLDSLGYLAHRDGEHTEALDHYRRVVALRRDLDDAYEEADALVCLGDVHHALGQDAEARNAWRRALALYRHQGRSDRAEGVVDRLAPVDGDPRP
ncbi:BTAD domain-containing putative transcriptional regulator [Embleya sp. NPDC005575]|uniref:AfsR/SARP family transcriptional regulator n=1 Tax=Embleya sp. NPDC005575 TaxID=3156892 RepID=UPI0033AD109A